MKPENTYFVKAVKAFALENYSKHCDFVIECMTDDEIEKEFVGTLTDLGDMLHLVVEDAENRKDQIFETAFCYEDVKNTVNEPTQADIVDFVKRYFNAETKVS